LKLPRANQRPRAMETDAKAKWRKALGEKFVRPGKSNVRSTDRSIVGPNG
jgi:hypothetical protein